MTRPLHTRILRRIRCALGFHTPHHGYAWDDVGRCYVYRVDCMWCGHPLAWRGRNP